MQTIQLQFMTRWMVLLMIACSLAAVSSAQTISLSNNVAVGSISGASGSQKFYRISVPSGQSSLEIRISGGSGDCDLYVKFGSAPTTTSWQYRPYLYGNNEAVTITNPAAGDWHIMLRGYTAYSGVTLVAKHVASSSPSVITPLANSVPVTNLSGAQANQRYFKIAVPSGQTKLTIAISGGSGDCDLYVKLGSSPTTTSYNYRPYLGGNNETVTVTNPAAGDWYIMLRGYTAYSGVMLLAKHEAAPTPPPVTTLQNGVALLNRSGGQGSNAYYKISVPAGQLKLEIKIYGGSGDCDLYVKLGSSPTTTSYNYRPYLCGNNETVTVTNPAAGDWHVMLRGYTAYSGVTLLAKYEATPVVMTLQNGVPVYSLSGAQASQAHYKITVPAGQAKLTIAISGGSGDCDLYVKRGSSPTTAVWDYRPYLGGNSETVTVNNPTAGDWFIMLHGYTAFSGVTLVATAGGNNTYAIVIGAADYTTSPDLDECVSDASNMLTYLTARIGVPSSNIKVLSDSVGSSSDTVNSATVQSAFQTWLQSRSPSSNDTVYVYYSGHGSPGGTIWPHDSSVTLATLDSWMSAIPAKYVVVLDSCFSGAAINSLYKPGRRIITACADNETSKMCTWGTCFWTGYSGSVFTSYLLDEAGKVVNDLNGDGKIELWEAFPAAKNRIENATFWDQFFNGVRKMHPQIKQ